MEEVVRWEQCEWKSEVALKSQFKGKGKHKDSNKTVHSNTQKHRKGISVVGMLEFRFLINFILVNGGVPF